MVKRGESARSEGEYCLSLGRVAPGVLSLLTDGYVMEYLSPVERSPRLIREAETLLRGRVWSQELVREERDAQWPRLLYERVGVRSPDWVSEERVCRTHGDCTVGNMLRRGEELVLADPVPPRSHVARLAEIDMGRLLQSALGWETVCFGDDPVEWEEPEFWGNKLTRERALFWCGVIALRINTDWSSRCPERLTPEFREWLRRTKETCFAKIGL